MLINFIYLFQFSRVLFRACQLFCCNFYDWIQCYLYDPTTTTITNSSWYNNSSKFIQQFKTEPTQYCLETSYANKTLKHWTIIFEISIFLVFSNDVPYVANFLVPMFDTHWKVLYLKQGSKNNFGNSIFVRVNLAH